MFGTRNSGLWEAILIVIVAGSLFPAQPASADGPPVQWQKTFGGSKYDRGCSVQQTSDGGYIIAGYTSSFGVVIRNVYLIKTEPNGSSQWQKTFGGNGIDTGLSVQQTSDGGYVIAGYALSSGVGLIDVYLIKTEPNGTLQWEKTFGGSEEDYGLSVQQTSDGGYVIVGFINSYGIGESDVYLIKTEPNGTLQWEQTFGGSENDYGRSVQQTSDGGYVIAGESGVGGRGYEVYLIKTDPNGNSQWERTFGGNELDQGYSVQQTSDGGYIIAGRTNSFGAGEADVYLIKTDPNGNSQWQKTFGGSKVDYGESVQQTSDDGYIIAGRTNSFGAGEEDVYLIKTNPNGDSQWQKTFGGSRVDYGGSVQQTSDGGYIISGATRSFGESSTDVYLIKLCPEGTLSGDLNCDGTVNYKDVKILVGQWLQPRSISYHADIYGVGDGIVDFLDYSTQVADLGKSSSPR